MRIFVAGGTDISRRAIIMLLQTKTEFQVVRDVATIEELRQQAHSIQPELVLLDGDYSMGFIKEVVDFLQNIESKPSLLILCGQDADKDAALAAGADISVYKGDPPKHLLAAVETIRVRRQDV